MLDTLINFGSEIKMSPDGKLGGYLVKFGSPDDVDLAGDYFDAATDFGIEDGAKTAIYLNHRQPLKTKKGKTVAVRERIGTGTLTVAEDGVLIEAILDEHEKYAGVLDKMGWSSGTAAHLVDREKSGKAFHIKYWPLGLDASVTPRPCQPQKTAVTLKSFLDELELESEPDPTPVKNVFEEELAERKLGVWQLQSAFETSMRKLATVAAASSVTGVTVDVPAQVNEAVASLGQRLAAACIEQINEYIETPNQEHFYLKQFSIPLVSEGLDSHSQAVVSAVEGFAHEADALSGEVKRWTERVRDKQEFRAQDPTKAGRTISAANKDRLAAVMAKLKELAPVFDEMHGALSELHEMAEAKKAVEAEVVYGLLAEFERLERRVAANGR